jgi:tRNA (guanine37-N1)-methyltransferase
MTPRLRFDVFTIFPTMFAGPLDESILQRARERGLLEIAIHDLRDWTHDRHRTVDDAPFGGGAGMVMKAPPIVEAVESTLGPNLQNTPILLMAASGRRFNQSFARALSTTPRVAVICGHYEGIDDRVQQILGCQEVSIGDFVLTGGEIPAMAIIDAVTRLLPGVINESSLDEESHDEGLVEYPHYTRPAVYRDLAVPEVLLSGHHARIAAWRREQSERRTFDRGETSD